MTIKEISGQVADLMEEFGLIDAIYEGREGRVAFCRDHEVPVAGTLVSPRAEVPQPEAPAGVPVNSPMNGIYYSTPSPNAAPFVREGEAVVAGQVIGLIEAMKVFNEITSPLSGTVEKIVAANGSVVHPGDPIMFIR